SYMQSQSVFSDWLVRQAKGVSMPHCPTATTRRSLCATAPGGRMSGTPPASAMAAMPPLWRNSRRLTDAANPAAPHGSVLRWQDGSTSLPSVNAARCPAIPAVHGGLLHSRCVEARARQRASRRSRDKESDRAPQAARIFRLELPDRPLLPRTETRGLPEL